jgi:hypothetical protein
MSKTVPLKRTISRANVSHGAMALGLALFVQLSAIGASGNTSGVRPGPLSYKGSDTIHSIQVSKSQTSKKTKIRLFPDARQQVLFFSVNGEDGKLYQLFLFDMDGRLVSQTNIRNKETTVLANMTEGNFLFEVFTDDERIENGQVTVR